ncbi:MAG TPA: ATP-binding protein [Opitutaceae bacterium]|nr:ATP-binding protein [Opitutaceae bacterium]
MTSLSRSVLLALLLLVGFLAVAFAVQGWLQRETNRVRAESAAAREAQLDAALALATRPPEQWDDAYRRRLGAVIGGFVTLRRDAELPRAPQLMAQALRFSRPLPGHPGWSVHADVRLPGHDRLQLMHQRALVAIVLLAAVLVLVPVWLGVFGSRPSPGFPASRPPWASVRAEAAGLEHFARVSVERADALEREHGARRRAEEDLEVSRTQLDRSLAERIRLGRELHDNTSQTLYAVALTIESVRRKLPADHETAPRLDQCLAEVKRLNQEVRDYLRELEPAHVQREPFAAALAAMLEALPAAGDVRIERRIDDDTAALVPTHWTADVVNILREAISNSLRHGGARQIVLRAERSEDSVAFAVSDDGAGFDPADAAGGRRGHGLANMQARAAALGGRVRVSSTPGKGTRVLLTIPVVSPT